MERPSMEERTMTIVEVAKLLGKTVGTVRYDMCRRPGRLPKWFKAPGGSRKPLWLSSTVFQFLIENAEKFGATTRSK